LPLQPGAILEKTSNWEPLHEWRQSALRRRIPFLIVCGSSCLLTPCCQAPKTLAKPIIEFTKLPPSGEGSPDKLHAIEGRVSGARSGQKVVLYARSGIWWIQPSTDQPFTTIDADSKWNNLTHPGSAYAALLVSSGYPAPPTTDRLPQEGGDVAAVTVADGAKLTVPAPKRITFSGYDWELREVGSDRGGTRNNYDPKNAWTDERGFLHLQIARRGDDWTCAEIRLTRSMGYGTYRFVVRDVSQLEPAAVLSLFTWDDSGPPREMDIEISRWGESTGKNAQYLVQPYYVPANTVRFTAPSGVLTHSLKWEPGRVHFRTAQGGANETGPVVDEHTFSSGVPSPGNETIHMNLYRFDNKANPMRRECEVIIEKFEYLP
jgi:hypothetical protein